MRIWISLFIIAFITIGNWFIYSLIINKMIVGAIIEGILILVGSLMIIEIGYRLSEQEERNIER